MIDDAHATSIGGYTGLRYLYRPLLLLYFYDLVKLYVNISVRIIAHSCILYLYLIYNFTGVKAKFL